MGKEMEWIEVKTLTVRREFRAGEWTKLSGEKTPCLDLIRNCGIGCECSAQILTAVPGIELAEEKCLCFNDRTKRGISEVKGTAKAIKEGPDEWIYEVQAKLVEAKANDHDQKAAAYYKAGIMKKAPPFVPSRVRVLNEQFGDPPFTGAGVSPGDHDCQCNKWGAVSVIDRAGQPLGLRLDEFEPIEWKENK